MKYFDKQWEKFYDRKEMELDLEPIDVLMLTLDEEIFIERCLHSIYREIPIKRLIVYDGGSKDKTIEILKKFPRVEIHVRPDIRTVAKIFEYMFSLTKTNWFALMDAHLDLEKGWYEKMIQNKDDADVLENSKRILGYHFFVEDKNKLEKDSRYGSMCHLIKKNAVKDFTCDDDYMWRDADIFFRYFIDKSGKKWKKISETYHIHNETERYPYSSDNEKNFRKYVFGGLKTEILDEDKKNLSDINNAKGMIKYLEPSIPVLSSRGIDVLISRLDRKWIEENGPIWLERYDKAKEYVKEKAEIEERKRLKVGLLTLLRTIDPDLPVLSGKEVDKEILKLSRSWIEKEAPKWLQRYDKVAEKNKI